MHNSIAGSFTPTPPRRALIDARPTVVFDNHDYRAGSPRALASIYREYRPHIVRWLASGWACPLVPRCDRDDVTQSVFLRLFAQHARLSYDPARPLAPYVRAITKSAAQDYWRQAKSRTARLARYSNSQPVEAHPSHEFVPDHTKLRSLAIEFFESLSPEMQNFALRRYVECRSQRELEMDGTWTRRQVRTLEGKVRAALTERGWPQLL